MKTIAIINFSEHELDNGVETTMEELCEDMEDDLSLKTTPMGLCTIEVPIRSAGYVTMKFLAMRLAYAIDYKEVQ